MKQFKGRIEQVPPAFSACKVDGHRAYALARKGQKVETEPRKTEVFSLELGEKTSRGDGYMLTIDCAGGTIAFDDSAEFAWTEGATLRITGDCGPKTIRVGTDGSSLTAEQLASIAYVNAAGKLKTMTLSSDGYLRPPPKGTKFFVR